MAASFAKSESLVYGKYVSPSQYTWAQPTYYNSQTHALMESTIRTVPAVSYSGSSNTASGSTSTTASSNTFATSTGSSGAITGGITSSAANSLAKIPVQQETIPSSWSNYFARLDATVLTAGPGAGTPRRSSPETASFGFAFSRSMKVNLGPININTDGAISGELFGGQLSVNPFKQEACYGFSEKGGTVVYGSISSSVCYDRQGVSVKNSVGAGVGAGADGLSAGITANVTAKKYMHRW
jgi:hypothetical protein